MSIDRDVARRLAELDRHDAMRMLDELHLMSASGLDQLLTEAASLIRDDPAIGASLAELARDAATAAGTPIAIPRATYLLAQAKAGSGDMTVALGMIETARAGFDALGSAAEALRTNLGKTQVLNEMGRHPEALQACAEILTEATRSSSAGSPAMLELVAAAHQNSGLCLVMSGQYETALYHYGEAEAGYQTLGAERALAEVTYDRGLALLILGQHAEALDSLQRATDAFRRGGYRALLAMASTNTAEVRLHRGEFQQSLTALAEAAEALVDISSPTGEQTRLLTAARAYLALNLLPEALATFMDALAALDGTDMAIDRARARWGLGLTLAKLGRLDEATQALDDAIDQFRRSGHSSWLAEVMVDQAQMLRTAGVLSGARRAAAQAVEIAETGTPAHLRARLLMAELTDAEVGADVLLSVVDDAQTLALAPLLAMAEHALGQRLLASGNLDGAEAALRTAVQLVEELRGGLASELVLTRFLDDKLSPYEDLLSVLVARAATPSAVLAVAEMAKSRTLTDIVSGLVDRQSQHRAPESEALDADLRALYGELFSGQIEPAGARSALLHRRVQVLEARRDVARLQETAADARHDTVPSVTRAPNTPGTPAISYAQAGESIHAFVIDDTSVEMVADISSTSTVVALVEKLQRQWALFNLGYDAVARHLPQLEQSTKAVLRQLFTELIAPLETLLRRSASTAYVVVPDGILYDVPFHALWDGASYLLDRYEIAYAPSMETLHRLPARRVGPSLVIGVADDLAPLVEDEAAAAANRLPESTSLLGRNATWAAIEPLIAGAAHIHLAGHAVFRPDNPMYSALKVEDRWITAADLLRLDLDGATVVLSACETARTQHGRTAEINGFVRGLLGAGAATVIASQWTADDRATTRFMELFYDHLQGATPSHAARVAQQRTAREWPHPYFWAPWIVVGRPDS
jgi:CHAT domain-containing protein